MMYDEEIKDFVQDRFNTSVKILRQLPSFEDTNFLCENESSKVELDRLVLKLLCKRPYHDDTSFKRRLKSKIDCFHHIQSKRFQCSVFLEGKDGHCIQEYRPMTKLDGKPNELYLAVLYTYLPGKELEHTGYVSRPHVLFQIGAFLGFFHKAFEDYQAEEDLIPELDNPWHSSNYHLLTKDMYLDLAQDKATKLKTIMKYASTELDSVKNLKKGILHGDFHGLNIIVPKEFDVGSNTIKFLSSPRVPCGSKDAFPGNGSLSSLKFVHKRLDCEEILKTFGLIDFEDISYSYLVLEVGRAIADAMVTLLATTSSADTLADISSNPSDLNMSMSKKECGTSSSAGIRTKKLEFSMKESCLKLGGWIICGYLSTNDLSTMEYDVILPAVLVALCQYYVLGVQAVQGNPSNGQYVGYCSKEALTLLEWMHAMEPQDIYQIWKIQPVLDMPADIERSYFRCCSLEQKTASDWR